MNWFGNKAKPDYCPDGPWRWIEIADGDIKRVHGGIYRKLGFFPHGIRGIPDTDQTYKEYARGQSTQIKLEDGYEAFKATYCQAEDSVFVAVKKLMHPGDELVVEFHCKRDYTIENNTQAFFSWVLKRKVL